jgi:hypothetical protein
MQSLTMSNFKSELHLVHGSDLVADWQRDAYIDQLHTLDENATMDLPILKAHSQKLDDLQMFGSIVHTTSARLDPNDAERKDRMHKTPGAGSTAIAPPIADEWDDSIQYSYANGNAAMNGANTNYLDPRITTDAVERTNTD